ncbi:MAG: phosphoglycerate dehydrogenase [Caulobacterales bacterium]|nr:phosphoglycerate dehydrogenase [Caulobacterales bacterium]
MRSLPTLLIDFDSTLVGFETLEALAEVALAGHPDAESRRVDIGRLTDEAMEGRLDFHEALTRRLALVEADRRQIQAVAERAVAALAPSVDRNLEALRRNAGRIWIVSAGFTEVIAPVAEAMGLDPSHILANDLVYDAQGRVVGVDTDNPLAFEDGKLAAVQALSLSGPVVMIGDGWGDWRVREAGLADRFWAFTEIVRRDRVVERADGVAASLDEILHAEGFAGRFSYPRGRMKVLLLENVHPKAAERLKAEGYQVEMVKGALDEAALIERIKGVHVLGIRSKTEVTARVLAAADRLLAIGAFCIGTNQIDLAAASDHGVAVFNAPYSNTRSVVELVLGLTITLTRRVADKSAALHAGRWDKSADGAHELRGRTLGIIGYGAIGAQLSVLAEALGMKVVFFDLDEKLALGNAQRLRSLDALLDQSDVVTLHVDGRRENAGLFGAGQLARMKPGAILLNLSRGHIVDVEALAEALRSGRLGGAAVDVFPEEPVANSDGFTSPLQGLLNVILTPHIGGSTEEAQEAIAEFAAERLLGFVNRGDTTFAVNLPNVRLSEVSGAHRLLHIHRNQPGVLAAINRALAEGGLNVLGQHLKTDERTGYVIVDVEGDYDPEALDGLKAVDGALRFRVLY